MTKKLVPVLILLLLIVGGTYIFMQRQAAEQTAQIEKLETVAQSLNFADKIITNRFQTPEELAAIQAECRRLSTMASDAKELKRANSLQTQLSALQNGCQSYAESVDLTIKYNQFDSQKAALINKPGVEGCADSIGCLNKNDFAEYRKLFQEDITLVQKVADSLQRACYFKELQAVCDAELKYYQKLDVLNQAYDKALTTGNVDAAARGYDSNQYPNDFVCSEVNKLIDLQGSTEDCERKGIKALATKYEKGVKAEINNLR